MNLSIWLGKVPPPLHGRCRVHVDGKPVVDAPRNECRPSHGDLQRQRIMDMIRRHGVMDAETVASRMQLTHECVRQHLGKLVRQEKLERIEPPRRGSGQRVTWRPR